MRVRLRPTSLTSSREPLTSTPATIMNAAEEAQVQVPSDFDPAAAGDARLLAMRTLVEIRQAIPAPDNSHDAVTGIFLFHELPPQVRRAVLAECARVLKPGGRLVLLDSLQRGDRPDYEGLLELFPQNYHEPYYESYLDEEWPAVSGCVGVFRIEGRGVQLFEKIEGDHFTVLGMPLLPVLGALRDLGEMPR